MTVPLMRQMLLLSDVDIAGLLVTPGLLDIHIHAYVDRLHKDNGSWMGSLNADAHFLKDGVTTAVDVGTAGCQEIEHFRRTVIEKMACRVLALVNIAAPGMGAVEQDISNFDVQGAASAAKEHADVVGIAGARRELDRVCPRAENVLVNDCVGGMTLAPQQSADLARLRTRVRLRQDVQLVRRCELPTARLRGNLRIRIRRRSRGLRRLGQHQ